MMFATSSPQTFHVVNVVAREKTKNQTKKQLLAKPTKKRQVQNKFARLVKHAFFCHTLPFITYGMRMKKKNKKVHCISASKQKNGWCTKWVCRTWLKRTFFTVASCLLPQTTFICFVLLQFLWCWCWWCRKRRRWSSNHGRNNRIVTTLFRAIKMIFFLFFDFFLFFEKHLFEQRTFNFLDIGTEAVAGCERDF